MEEAPSSFEKGKLYDLNVADLAPDPGQPSKYFDDQALQELKVSIEKHGVLQPILVRRGEDGRVLLVSGERRFHATQLAGLPTIPALFTDGNPAEIAIVENLLREDLTAIEEAEAIDRLKREHDYQLSDLAAVLGKAESTLSEILSLAKLPDSIRDDCRNDPRASRHVLVEIAKERSDEKMTLLYDRYKAKGLTRGEIKKRQRARVGEGTGLEFIGNCARRIQTLDLRKLDEVETQKLAEQLEMIRAVAKQKIRQCRT